MKNQYFGDVNDFKKYGLLKQLSKTLVSGVAVCWALTTNDTRSDGSRIRYLENPDEWRAFDPSLFDFVRAEVLEKRARSLNALEEGKVLPGCHYFEAPLVDGLAERDRYFDEFFRFALGSELVFFDPDNGLGITATQRGKRGSSKYVYPCEVERAWTEGHSVLFYQHFPRRPRGAFLDRLALILGGLPGLSMVRFFITSHVAFVLLPRPEHRSRLEQGGESFAQQWAGVVRVVDRTLRDSGESLEMAKIPREEARSPRFPTLVKTGAV